MSCAGEEKQCNEVERYNALYSCYGGQEVSMPTAGLYSDKTWCLIRE